MYGTYVVTSSSKSELRLLLKELGSTSNIR